MKVVEVRACINVAMSSLSFQGISNDENMIIRMIRVKKTFLDENHQDSDCGDSTSEGSMNMEVDEDESNLFAFVKDGKTLTTK